MSQSPTPRKLMTFPEAMEAAIAGKRVAREEWHNEDYISLDKPGFLSIHFENGDKKTLAVSDGDMINNDWVVISEH